MSRRSRKRSAGSDLSWKRVAMLSFLAIVAFFGREWLADVSVEAGQGGFVEASAVDDEVGVVEALYESRRSGEMVVVVATVDRLLADDDDGSRHQRFIVRLESGHTLLVAHNIDLAERVPLSESDRVRMRGEYEWNEQGGVLHWTHHDPRGAREGGWIDFAGNRYR